MTDQLSTSDFTMHNRLDSAISAADFDLYWREVGEAFAVHLNREEIRHGLWKEFPAADQARQIKSKVDRVLRALELVDQLKISQEEAQDSILEELDDIINYAIFAKRIVKGDIGV